MGLARAPEVAAALIGAGRAASTPEAIVIDASVAASRADCTTLDGLAHFDAGDTSGAALLFVGPQFRARAARRVAAADAQETVARAV